MSHSTSNHRIRPKTADLADFFRSDPPQAPSSSSGIVTTSNASTSSTKNKRSRIPFLGRSRKKSLTSEQARPSTADSHSSISPVTPKLLANGHTVLMISPPSEPRPQPSLEILPSVKASTPSLGSKLAAHFTPSKSRPVRVPSLRKSSVNSLASGSKGEPRPPSPASRRAPSFESASSSLIRNRSPTPRPTRPNITVSVSPPDDKEIYANLFTMPRSSPATQTRHTISQRDVPETATTSPAPPQTTPSMQFPKPPLSNPPLSKSRPREDDVTVATKTPKGRQHKNPAVIQLETALGTKLDMDSAEETTDTDKGSVLDIGPWSSKRSSVSSVPYKPSERASGPSRSSMKAISAFGRGAAAPPPSIPLPSPPSSVSSQSSAPNTPSLQNPKLSSMAQTGALAQRPRAHTISSVPEPVPNVQRVTSSSRSPSTTPSPTPTISPNSSIRKPKAKVQNKSLEKEKTNRNKTADEALFNTPPEELRQALTTQNARFDELSGYLLTIVENHVAEKAVLEKRIDVLEREARKREREIKGLRYLVMNGTGSFTTSASSVGTSTRPVTPAERDHDLPVTPSHSLRSVEDSQRSDSRMKSRHERLVDSLSRSDSTYHQHNRIKCETSSSTLAIPGSPSTKTTFGLDLTVPDTPYSYSLEKRSSISSFSSSAASSTSSLSLHSHSTPNMVSSALSAIPESTPPAVNHPQDPAVAAAILAAEKHREKEERRISRALRRISSSSSSSSVSAAATNAYASNMKRGRPPSIAQVLEQSPSMEDVLQKLRPFGTAGSDSN